MSHRSWFAILFCLTGLASEAWSAELEVSDAWIRLLPAGVPAAGYFKLRNDANQPVVLISVSSRTFEHVMMHRTIEEKGQSRMLHLDRIEVPARGLLTFASGGYHLMLTTPTRNVALGDRIAITLEFTGGRRLTTEFEVRGPSGK